MNTGRAPLSVAIITKNEEKMLPACLESVAFAEDVVVVDSGSGDLTVKIAEERGCRVFVEDWKGFGPQKTSAVEKCLREWVLVLDADERIPEETKEEIVAIVSGRGAADAYGFPIKAYFHDRWIRHCGWWPDEKIRLFRKSKGRISNRAVHERTEIQGVTERLSCPIIHYPMPDIETVVRKINQYSSLGAEELLKAGRRTSYPAAVFHAAASFAKSYILKLGVLDGGEGFFISFTGAVTTFYKYAKLLELGRTKLR